MDQSKKAAFARKVGAELRELREAAGLSQQQVSDLFGWGRDAMSKFETGKNQISLLQYLEIVRFLRDVVPPEHPGLALADRFRAAGGHGRRAEKEVRPLTR